MRHTLQKKISRLMALTLAALLLLCAIPSVSAEEASGVCGADLTWSFSGDILTITGSGAMYDYPEETMAPWYDYRNEISTIVLPKGLTRVGDLAFYGCSALEWVTLPDTVTEVGWYAFAGCTGLRMLDLGSSLQVIEDGAFKECKSLLRVTLPNTLTTIGFQAFYRCESLTQITVPASVTSLGMTVFAFCYQLITADIQARITRLPEWTFYGCERLITVFLPDTMTGTDDFAFHDCPNLTGVVYPGSEESREQIEDDIQQDRQENAGHVTVDEEPPEDSNFSFVVEETDDGFVANSTATKETENGSVSTDVTTTFPADGSDSTSTAKVTVTIENSKGWDEVEDVVMQTVQNVGRAEVEIYLRNGAILPGAVLAALAGKNVTLIVYIADSAIWKIDCVSLDRETLKASYDLSYVRMDATEGQLEKMGCTAGYQIRFADDIQMKAEVLVKLPAANGRKTATLHQEEEKNRMTALQDVLVDDQGYAHFYLGSVSKTTVYLIGLDIPGKENAIIPSNLHADYGITDSFSEVEYVLTGRTSSWGMNINQVTWILAGVMGFSMIAVGIVMFALNKRKLRRGYIPDLDDEEL